MSAKVLHDVAFLVHISLVRRGLALTQASACAVGI